MSKIAERPASWREESHSNDVDPNYAIVFPGDAVNTLTITFTPDDWAAMQADITDIYTTSRPIREAIIAAGGADLAMEKRVAIAQEVMKSIAAAKAAEPSSPKTTAQPAAAQWSGAAPSDAMVPQTSDTGYGDKRSPMWVPATISFQGQEWSHVGVRYKGVSSLGLWMMDETRLPFKLNFDKFEDDYPAIKNQRFFGFKELALANNYSDPAGMRDTLVYDLLEEAGIPSLQSAPVEIMLDYGEGPELLGLYTLNEVVDDTGVAAYFGGDDGNIYEGDGIGASLATAHADKIAASFDRKNNEDEADWSDIWALYEVLHDARRTSDPAAWRADLEAVFEVEPFLKWLGIRAIVGHYDSYGTVPHNFYLYNNPATGRLTWISWDHNLTFLKRDVSSVSLDKPDVPQNAPLSDFLLGDPVYYARYKELLAETFAGVAAPLVVKAKVRAYADLIAPSATKQMTPAEYDTAVQEILDFIEQRAPVIEAFLAKQE